MGVGVLCIAKVVWDVAMNEVTAFDFPAAGIGAGLILAGIALHFEGKPAKTG